MRVPPKPPAEPGEWQTDKYGKRYRKVGDHTIEYEIEIGSIPQSDFLERNRRTKEILEAKYKEEQRRAAERAAQRRNCPFRDGMQTDCTREACALFLNGCTLAMLADQPPAKATEGLQCPFSRYRSKCRTDCALYKGGCTLTGITTNKESEDK